MNIQELQFLKRENIPVKVIILNNESLGMIRHFQEMYFNSKFVQAIKENGYSSPNFTKIAEAYGLKGINVSKIEEVQSLKEELFNKEPILINISLGDKTYVYPKLAVGKPIDDQEPLIDRKLYEELKCL